MRRSEEAVHHRSFPRRFRAVGKPGENKQEAKANKDPAVADPVCSSRASWPSGGRIGAGGEIGRTGGGGWGGGGWGEVGCWW